MRESAYTKALPPSTLRSWTIHTVSSWKRKSMLSLVMKGKTPAQAANYDRARLGALDFLESAAKLVFPRGIYELILSHNERRKVSF